MKFFLYALFVKSRRRFTDRNLKLYKDFKVKVSKNSFFKIIYFGGTIERETYRKGLFKTWENDLGWLWIELCQISDIIMDVGANTGIYSLAAKAMNPHSKVFAFEPSKGTFKKLKSNIELNQFDIIAEQLAVSNNSDGAIFYDPQEENQTTASLSPYKMKYLKDYKGKIEEYKVPTITLANYIKKNKIKRLDLIKIDVELHEAEAINGMGEYLKKLKPIICIEILNNQVADQLSELFDLKDFFLFHLRKDGSTDNLSQFKVSKESIDKGEWNYVIFHKSMEKFLRNNTSLYQRINT